MRTLRAIQIAGAVAALAFAFAPPVWAQDAGVAKDEAAAQASPSLTGSFKPPTARVRYIHAIAGAWRTDLRFETRPVWTNIVNTGGTPFKAVPLGTYQAAVTSPLGNTTMIGPEPITIGLGIDYTVLAVGALSGEPPFEMVVATWPAIPVPSYATCFAAIHASPDAPPIDILVDATPHRDGARLQGLHRARQLPARQAPDHGQVGRNDPVRPHAGQLPAKHEIHFRADGKHRPRRWHPPDAQGLHLTLTAPESAASPITRGGRPARPVLPRFSFGDRTEWADLTDRAGAHPVAKLLPFRRIQLNRTAWAREGTLAGKQGLQRLQGRGGPSDFDICPADFDSSTLGATFEKGPRRAP